MFDGVLPDDSDTLVRIRFKHQVAKERFEFFLDHYAAFKVQPRWYADGWEVEIPMHYFSRYLLKYYDPPIKPSWMAFEMEREDRLPPGLSSYLRLKASTDYDDEGIWAVERLQSAQYFAKQQFAELLEALNVNILHVELMSSFPEAKQLDIEILTPGATFPQQKILIVGKKFGEGETSHLIIRSPSIAGTEGQGLNRDQESSSSQENVGSVAPTSPEKILNRIIESIRTQDEIERQP